MKRLFTIFLFAILFGSSAFAYDFSAVCESGQTLYYNITSNTEPYTVSVSANNEVISGELVIPSTVIYNGRMYMVTNIGGFAFSNCSDLTSVTIPNSITSIDIWAFGNCSGLISLTIPNSIAEIGDLAFYRVRNIVYNGSLSVSSWGALTVNGYVDGFLVYSDATKTYLTACSSLATEVSIPNSVTMIGYAAFEDCKRLESVTIPNSVRTIYNYTFSGCSSLQSVVIPNSVTSISESAFSGCYGLTSLLIPNSVTNIGDNAFGWVKNIIYSGSATGSPWGALTVNGFVDGCLVYSDESKTNLTGCSISVTEVTIPNSVTSIGKAAFNGCRGLTSLTIPNSVASIDIYAFYDCSGITTITYNATNCSTIGTIDNPSFSDCQALQILNIGDNVTSIPAYAFKDCSNLTTINFNAVNCTAMGDSNAPVFAGCTSLEMLNIGDNVTNIPAYAFKNCSSLNSITIGISVRNIGNYSFNGCTSLSHVNYNGSIEQWCGISFGEFGGGIYGSANPLYLAHNLYINNNLVTDLVVPESITEIKDYAFDGATCLVSVAIPNSVARIGESAFSGCSGLTSITMGNSVNIIGNSAFYECTGLTAVYYMGNIEQWCEITFNSQPLAYAHNLYINNELVTGLVIPEIIPEIKRSAFSGATCLTSVTIPNSVTSIGEYAFYNCSGLTTIVIGNSVTSIGAGAFYECSGINVLNYNAENCTINGGLFNVRNTLSKIIIGENVATIPDNAYLNCTLLDSIISLTENPPVIYASTFDSSLSHNIPVIVPCGTVEAYEDADFWYDFRHIQQSSDCGSSYTITVISANPNRGTVTGGGTYPAGTVISIEANAFDDFEFVSWNDGNTDNPRYLTVSGDAMFIASFDPAGIEENSMSGISIFPNPTNDILNITSSEEISEIEIVNTLGQVVCRTEVNRDNAVCDVEGLTSGVYVVRIHGTDTASICQKKFVKE